MSNVETHRKFFANLITASAHIHAGSELAAALSSIPREQFVGPPPWKIFTPMGYIQTPSDDPTFLYQDVVVSLSTEGPYNNGQPSLHAFCLAALAPKKGEHVIHVGAGTGYYTTVLAKLVGDAGIVHAFEVEPDLARRATANLAGFPSVSVQARSGAEGSLPPCDVLYVNAGATEPLAVWLDALRPNGRLLFPLTPAVGVGAMLLITKQKDERFAAHFVVEAQFVPCMGARTAKMEEKLNIAFRNTGWGKVKSLHRNNATDESCWLAGEGWWLSTTD